MGSMEVKRRDRDGRVADTGSRSPHRAAQAVPPAVHSVLSLSRMAGNAAVVRILARQPPVVAPPAPKPIAVGAVEGGPIVFKTKAAKLGDVEVHFEGRLTVGGRASLEGDTEPEEKDLPDPANKNRTARVHRWAESRVRDQLKAALDGLTPTGTGEVIELDVLGRKVKLELARGVAGLPDFVIHGAFAPPKAAAVSTGTVRIPKATFSLQATAVIKPAPSKATAAPAPADDALVKKKGFTFDGEAAVLEDRLRDPTKPGEGTYRSGAVALFQSLKDMDALPDIVKNKWALSTTEKKLAFLVHMRSYFATDAETIEHFKKLRRVELRKKGTPTNLILHDEAATRLEAVRDELPAGSMPSTETGWPRGAPSLHGRAGLYNLHDLGFAVDFNATETPNLTDWRQKDLILLVTGGQAWQSGGSMEGDYADMAKHTEQRAPMPDPDPQSDLGKRLTKIESEAKAASERSEAFRTSVDATKLLELRAKRRKNQAWADTDDAALAKVIEPWTKAVDDDMAKNTKTLQAAGFDVASLKHGDALGDEKKAVSAAAGAAAAFRKGVKGDTLTDAQRKTADALIAKLTGLVKPATAAGTAPATDADRLKAIDELAAAAGKRLGAYGAVTWRERLEHLQGSLKDAGWVLGGAETRVLDPSPAQLVDLGFFTLRDHSRSAPGGTAQPGAFDIPFIKAMAKHGFYQLSHSSTPVDSMHFELRWRGTKKK